MSNETRRSIPTLYAVVFDSNLVQFFELVEEIYGANEKPDACLYYSTALNFFYCAIPTRRQDVSPLGLFQATADLPVWLCLIAFSKPSNAK